MSHVALIKLAPVRTAERMNDEAWADRTFYRDQLQLLPNSDGIPLVVDHDRSIELGRVTGLFTMDWPDGDWICARAELTDPPAEVKQGMAASFGRHDATPTRSFVTEVSLLIATEPLEPAAQLVALTPAENTAARTRSPEQTLLHRDAVGQVLGVR